MTWQPIETLSNYKVVLLYRTPDLYPVVGSQVEGIDGKHWILEENGPEDGEHRRWPFLEFAPTHWSELPSLPADCDGVAGHEGWPC